MTGIGQPGPVQNDLPAGAPPRPERLRVRAEFLRVAGGARFHARAFSLQSRAQEQDKPQDKLEDSPQNAPLQPRFGLTVTRKTGTSTERNRIRRRLREALRRAAPLEARPGTDYVIVARRDALSADFQTLVSELARAMRLIASPKPRGPRRSETR